MSSFKHRKHIATLRGALSGKTHDPWTAVGPFGRMHKAISRSLLPVFLAGLAMLFTVGSYAAPLRTVTATITRISDGDTVQALTPEGTKLKVRLYGIDAPETAKGKFPGEPFGNASRDYLASLVSQRTVRVEIRDIDRYRRIVAILWLGEKNVNLDMVAAGMAEAYGEYLKGPYRSPFLQAEQEAKAQGKGIWSQGSRYERPSEFRKRMGG